MNLHLISSFAKFNHSTSSFGGTWSNRFSGRPLGAGISDPISLFYYVVVPEGEQAEEVLTLKNASPDGTSEVVITGKHPQIGTFTLAFAEEARGRARVPRYPRDTTSVIADLPDPARTHFLGVKLPLDEKHHIGDIVKRHLTQMHRRHQRVWRDHLEQKLGGTPGGITRAMIEAEHPPLLVTGLPNTVEKGANVLVVQRILGTPFEVDVGFIPHGDVMKTPNSKLTEVRRKRVLSATCGDALSSTLEERRNAFVEGIEEKFALERKRINPVVQQIVYPIISNLIGGMAFFHGRSVIRTPVADGFANVLSDQYHHLFTAVPSRPSFPRGFLWDEGFHQLLIHDWSADLTMQSLSSWLSLMDENGWIAREQILGAEARSRVPEEFIAQSKEHGNPPTFFLVVEKMLRHAHALRVLSSEHEAPDSAHAMELVELVPYTTTDERTAMLTKYTGWFAAEFDRLQRHLDWYSQTQAGIAPDLYRWRGRRENHTFTSGLDDYPRARFPSDTELHVDLASWVAFGSQVMADLASFLQMDGARHAERAKRITQRIEEEHFNTRTHLYSDIADFAEHGKSTFVDHIGYVNLFPLALGLIPKDSPRLLYTLKAIESEKKLWSPYGLRSLSLSDPYYGKGDHYWTGPIWVNINYLVLRGLKLHYVEDGPYHEAAQKIYKELREALTVNIFTRYQETGYVWEQYDPVSGQGQKSHPFTGWTALVVSILAEQY